MKFYDQINAHAPENIDKKRAFIVGSGIAGLSAAVYLIQDAHMPAENITLYEAKDNFGGALEAFGNENVHPPFSASWGRHGGVPWNPAFQV